MDDQEITLPNETDMVVETLSESLEITILNEIYSVFNIEFLPDGTAKFQTMTKTNL